jgi:hypothetical protein
MKICTKCKIEKDESEFSKCKGGKNGLCSRCKKCKKEYHKQWYLENKERIKQRQREYYQENKEEILKKHKQYKIDHKEELSEKNKQYTLEHKEERREYSKRHYQEHREKILERQKRHNQEHREEKREQENKRRKNDICFRLRKLVSITIGAALKRNQGGKRGGSILNYLSYTIQELKAYLESQFDSWMTWENHGLYDPTRDTWQIDHIIPHSSFRYETMDCDEFRKCWALENLRPLKTINNIKKGNKPLANTTTK